MMILPVACRNPADSAAAFPKFLRNRIPWTVDLDFANLSISFQDSSEDPSSINRISKGVIAFDWQTDSMRSTSSHSVDCSLRSGITNESCVISQRRELGTAPVSGCEQTGIMQCQILIHLNPHTSPRCRIPQCQILIHLNPHTSPRCRIPG